MLGDRNVPGFSKCVSMLLNNAHICLNMPEREPKITVQAM